MKLLVLLFALACLSGCPRDVTVPDAPRGATSCASELECNEGVDGGAPCGLLRRCIEGLCEASPSREVPCGRKN